VPNESSLFYRRTEYPPAFSSPARTRTWELHRNTRTSLRRGRLLHQSGLKRDRPTPSSRRSDLLSAPNPLEVTRPGIRSPTAICSGPPRKVIRLDIGLTLHFLPAGRKYARAPSHERAVTVTCIALARILCRGSHTPITKNSFRSRRPLLHHARIRGRKRLRCTDHPFESQLHPVKPSDGREPVARIGRVPGT